MFALAKLFYVFVVIYRFIVTSWNAFIVLQQVVQPVMEEAKQEAAELMGLLNEGASVMDALTTTTFKPGAHDPAHPCSMLIIARASSFVLLLRLSKRRVLHLEIDEKFIASKLEVIKTELMLHVQHVPRLLQLSIGTHDTRLVRYTPMRLPYLWKEELAGPSPQCRGEVVEESPASTVSTEREEHSHRRKYVQLLTESTLRRRLHMDRLGDAAPKKGTNAKIHEEKRKALANATNTGSAHPEGTMMNRTYRSSDETHRRETDVAETPKRTQMERHIHAALNENLSIPNLARAAGSAQQPRRTGLQSSIRRRRGQFGLYAPGVSSEFSLALKTGQERV